MKTQKVMKLVMKLIIKFITNLHHIISKIENEIDYRSENDYVAKCSTVPCVPVVVIYVSLLNHHSSGSVIYKGSIV